MSRSRILAAMLGTGLLGAALGAMAGIAEPISPMEVQEIEVISRPTVQQDLGDARGVGQQELEVPQPVTPAQRTASNVGKVTLGVLAAGIAIAAAAASLLLL